MSFDQIYQVYKKDMKGKKEGKYVTEFDTINFPVDTKYVELYFCSTGCGNSFDIVTDKIRIMYKFSEEDKFIEFDDVIQNNMKKNILPFLELLNLDILEIIYDVEDDYDANDFLPYFNDFVGENIKYISLKTRGIAASIELGKKKLQEKFKEKLYLECPECQKYYKATDVDANEHKH